MTDLRFLRRNYALLQYSQTNIRNRIDLTFRWTQNLDDGSRPVHGARLLLTGQARRAFLRGNGDGRRQEHGIREHPRLSNDGGFAVYFLRREGHEDRSVQRDSRSNTSAGDSFSGLLYVVVIDTLIAVFLSATGISPHFIESFVMAQSYGIFISSIIFPPPLGVQAKAGDRGGRRS